MRALQIPAMIKDDSETLGVHRSVDLLFAAADGRILLQFRDGRATHFPLTWSFWGGSLCEEDPDIFAAAARETREELSLDLTPHDFTECGLRVGSNGNRAYLLRCDRPIDWPDIAIREGSGGGFFTLDEMRMLPVTKAIRFYLDHAPHALRAAGPTCETPGDRNPAPE